MGFIDDLQNGRPGIRLVIPPDWKVHEEQPRRAVLLDNDRRVGWHIAHAPVAMDLRRESETVLRKDLERHARHLFSEQYGQLKLPPELASRRPPLRTSDPSWPDWSPIIHLEHVQIAGGEALWILRRQAFEPAMEIVLSTLLVPLQTGVCEITAFHRTTDSGESSRRESFLIGMAAPQHPGKKPEEIARILGQSYLDDAKHDEQFPQSPVALARAAGRWLLGDKERLQITAPLPAVPGGEVILGASECAIVPPPRYLPISAQGLGVPPSMSVLTRVLLDVTDNPRVLDLWLLPEALPADNRQQALEEMAKRAASDWERQGATEVEADVKALPPQGEQLRVASAVKMRLGEGRAQTVMRWVAEPDGRVFRISLGAPPYVPREELEAEADQVLKSFRRQKPQLRDAWLTNDTRLRPKSAPAQA